MVLRETRQGRLKCTKCHSWFPKSAFYARAGGRLRQSWCKGCAYQVRRRWIARNREKHRGYFRKWARKNAKYNLLRGKRWRRRNPEKVRRAYRLWMRRNPEKARQINRTKKVNRRAAKLSAGGTFTTAEILMLYRKQKGRCAYCGTRLGSRFHRDHKIPLCRKGRNVISNIALACGPCNWAKGKMTHIEFRRRLRDKAKWGPPTLPRKEAR